MRITEQQLAKIQCMLPIQRKPADVETIDFLNGVHYVIENGCKWRAMSLEFGNWHTIYTRFNGWCKKGTLDAVFLALQEEGIICIETEIVCLDSTSVKVHPDGTGALKKYGDQAIGRSKGGSTQRFMWLPRPPKVR